MTYTMTKSYYDASGRRYKTETHEGATESDLLTFTLRLLDYACDGMPSEQCIERDFNPLTGLHAFRYYLVNEKRVVIFRPEED